MVLDFETLSVLFAPRSDARAAVTLSLPCDKVYPSVRAPTARGEKCRCEFRPTATRTAAAGHVMRTAPDKVCLADECGEC
jgi:hypothetical protein